MDEQKPQLIYWLKTAAVPGSDVTRFANLYLRLAGSGSDAVVLHKDPPKFLRTHEEDGKQIFTSWKHAERKWGLVLEGKAKFTMKDPPPNQNREIWAHAMIRENEGDVDFAFSEGEERLSHSLAKGWMACEWSLGHPQLFWLTPESEGKELPDFCDRVVLTREPVVGQGESL